MTERQAIITLLSAVLAAVAITLFLRAVVEAQEPVTKVETSERALPECFTAYDSGGRQYACPPCSLQDRELPYEFLDGCGIELVPRTMRHSGEADPTAPVSPLRHE